jgi:hypothetical protein
MEFLKRLPLLVGRIGLLCLALSLPQASSALDTVDDYRNYSSLSRISEADLQSFEEYLDSHWQVADELYRNPELINDRVYVRKNPSLRRWLVTHPRAARAIRTNPHAVLWHERDSRDDEGARQELSDEDLRSWEEFLDAHEAIARELYRNPDLLKDANYIRRNQELDDWLYSHRRAARIITANPREYARRGEDSSSGDTRPLTAEEVREFERFLDREWEIANALYREPELVNSREFLRDNPTLANWLREHPRMARAVRERPREYLWRQRGLSIDDFLRQLLTPPPGN